MARDTEGSDHDGHSGGEHRNAGVVHEWGVEVGLTGWLMREISLSGSYAYLGFDVREQLDVLEANTPKHRGPRRSGTRRTSAWTSGC
jgi:hypothetical protein